MKNISSQRFIILLILAALMVGISPAMAQISSEARESTGSGFSYAGQLLEDGQAYQGYCDFHFSLWDAEAAGDQVGGTQAIDNILVKNGLFIVTLNQGGEFGISPFNGQPRWLELAVRCPGGSGDYSTLSPRQELTPTPYATYSATSPWSGLSGMPAGFADGEDNDLLASLSCANGQIPEWGDTAWRCGTDKDTLYSAGSFLTLTETAFNVTGAPWSGLAGVPDGFADGIDNDTLYSAGDGLTLNGTEFKLDYQAIVTNTQPANLVIVAKQNGDFEQIQAAMDSITDASPTNPYLVWVAPGIYTETVTMMPYVALQGAGENATVISFSGGGFDSGTLFGSENAILRNLTVRSIGEGTYAYALRNSASDFVIENVLVQVAGSYTSGIGIFLEDTAVDTRIKDCTVEISGTGSGVGIMATTNILLDDTSVHLTSTNGGTGVNTMSGVLSDVSITLDSPWNTIGLNVSSGSNVTLSSSTIRSNGANTGYGIYNSGGSLLVDNSFVSASDYGIYRTNSALTASSRINNSHIHGGTHAIYSAATDIRIFSGSSLLEGGLDPVNGKVTCAGVYDGSYMFYATSCP